MHDNNQEPLGAIKIPIESMNHLVDMNMKPVRAVQCHFPLFFSFFAVPSMRPKLAVTRGLDVHTRTGIQVRSRHTQHNLYL